MSYKNIKFKISAPISNEDFESLDGSYQIFRTILNIYSKQQVKNKNREHGEKKVNPSLRRYTNNLENIITFKKMAGYYLELLTPEAMKLLGSTKIETTKDENGRNM